MSGVLGPGPDAVRAPRVVPEIAASAGLRVGHRVSRFVGTVVACDNEAVTLRSPDGNDRLFRLTAEAFVIEREGKLIPVTLLTPRPAPPVEIGLKRTASGSLAVERTPARIARAGRIWVEGVHDAELVERVWGDDLRVEGIVVERLDGLDDVAERVAAFRPGPGRPLGILVDHLVVGSKEARITQTVVDRWGPDVLVAGHPYVDVWQAVAAARVGLSQWPEVPRHLDWKTEMAKSLRQPDVRSAWRMVLASVRTWTDLDPSFVGPVESLIDHVFAADDAAADGSDGEN
jgi:Protein of unknown function (DUF3097)